MSECKGKQMVTSINHELFVSLLKSARANLENNKQKVNDLNVFPVPDGDTGTNMALTIQYAVKECASSGAQSISEAVSACSNGALMGARGNSGVILSQLFRGFSKRLKSKTIIDVFDLADAFAGASEMAYKAVMKPTEGTILTVAREMSEYAAEMTSESSDTDIAAFLEKVIQRGYVSLENTPNLLPVLAEAGVIDAGGQGLLFILEGALSALRGTEITENEVHAASEFLGERIPDIMSEIEYTYCTEFLIKVKDGESYQNFLIDKLLKLGDSLLVIQDDDIIKVHVHTNEPWTAMKYAAGCGELAKIKIDNMREQHRELFEEDLQSAAHKIKPVYPQEKKEYITIAVSSGSGLGSVLKDLGVDCLIEGGQTMNPSTQDFLDIINNTNAENYILLPNNKNIILAALQTQKMSEKRIEVLSTNTIPEAICAMMEYNPENSLEENMANMSEAVKTVQTAMVTYAVRDSVNNDTAISKDDFIGIVNGEIRLAEKDASSALVKSAELLIGADTELLTVYYGEDISESDADSLVGLLREKFEGIDIEIFYGGQPIYYFIISAE